MQTNKNLTNLREGEWGIVDILEAKEDMRRRFMDLGLIQGTKVQCVQKSPYGDPVAYRVRGAVIAIRNQDAHGIYIQEVPRWA